MMRRFRTRRDIDKRFQVLQEMAVELIQATAQHDLLTLIVNKAMDLMGCDGGSLYLVSGPNELTFEVALNRTISVDFERTHLSADGPSVAAHVFRTNTEGVRVSDVYALPKDGPFTFDRSFDKRMGYRTRTMLALPLVSSKGKRLGVLQLVNRKKNPEDAWPSESPSELEAMPEFSDDDEMLLRSFAAIASASIEKSSLYRDIENLLQGIIRASVQAIESRDVATSGHSERVACLTVELAKKVTDSDDSEVRDIRLSPSQLQELRYASLLHDFGKISVHESILLKPKKLFEEELLQIRTRLEHFGNTAEIRLLWDALRSLSRERRAPADFDIARLTRSIESERSRVEAVWRTVNELNEPTVLDESKSQQLSSLKDTTFTGADGHPAPILRAEELKRLGIKRGSLSEEERVAIENHVTSTYRFLKEIPWTEEYRNVPEIAYAHHEKLTGNGYPRKLKAPEIPLQARMMAICDIFDALVAADRPYKKAVPLEKALAILEADAKSGALDARFFKIFLEAKIYELPEFHRLNPAYRAA
jgi:HD-GYP domain-containing protein (c-di-GMP phosphodiesterase class II)